MAKMCITEKTASRQRWIENGLLELMGESKFENITVTNLCQHLGLSRRSFYRYFGDMADVLDSLMMHTFLDMNIIDASLSLAELESHYEFWFRQKPLLNALAYSGMHSEIVHYALKFANERTLKQYLSDDDRNMDLGREINLFVISGLSSLLIIWYTEGFQKTPKEMAQIAHRMLCKPLLDNDRI